MSRSLWRPLALTLLLIPTLLAKTAQRSRAQPPLPDVAARITQDRLREHVYALSVTIGTRPAGSEAEARAARYVADQLAGWGYTVETQRFPLLPNNPDHLSQNVIGIRLPARPSPDSRLILVGAHLDCVAEGTGADDNGSGVAVMLAVAEALADLDSVHTLVFIGFGGEEVGERGSRYYVDRLTDDQIGRILAMINVDTVGIGDTFYVYAGAIATGQTFRRPYTPGPVWVRDTALAAASALGHSAQTTPTDGWNGFTGPWSDHYPFTLRGVPTAYFERWNWTAGPDPAWGQETAEAEYLHTPHDTFENVDPAKMEPVAETLALTVAQIASGSVVP